MISFDLNGRRALVTGAASGIGLATAELLARSGAVVALNDLPNNAGLDREIERLTSAGLNVLSAPGDVGDPDGARAMVRDAVAALDGLDILVNNAGTPGTTRPIPSSDLDAQTEEFWAHLLSVNLIGPFRCVHAAAPALKASRGAVVNVASTAGLGRRGSSSVYSATKAGLINLTKELAHGLAPEVRVNAVAPGMVDSGWECRFEDRAVRVESCPLKRIGTPQDFAEVIVFLAAGASYVTGHTVVVDGGLTA